jgi:glutathione S-transferase
MKVFGDIISPFVRMVMVTAHEVGLWDKVKRETISVPPDKVNQDLAQHGPLGKIPVLVTDHGHPLYDSRVIIEYLCHISGNRTLIPDDGVKRFRVLTIQALGQGIADAAVAYRYETATRPKDLVWAAFAGRQKARALMGVDDAMKTWLRDLEQVTAGSIAMAVALSYIDFRLPDWKWRDGRSTLAAWHAGFEKRASMQATKLA